MTHTESTFKIRRLPLTYHTQIAHDTQTSVPWNSNIQHDTHRIHIQNQKYIYIYISEYTYTYTEFTTHMHTHDLEVKSGSCWQSFSQQPTAMCRSATDLR